jgi:antitoxin component HigA of HigAB toxin-antitoxin module
MIINTEKEYNAALVIVESLIDQEVDGEDANMLTILALAVEKYEEKNTYFGAKG